MNGAGWAWGCLFYDLDNNGDKEIFVTNGNTSFRDPDAPDYRTFFWRQVVADAEAIEQETAFAEVLPEARRDFRGSFSGDERDRLFYNTNEPSDRFVESAYVTRSFLPTRL